MVQESVLQGIDSDELRAYAVWEPILRTDNESSSRKATTLFPDSRVTNYWADMRDVGIAFQAPIDLAGEPGWDVYLVYPPGVKWTGDSPPRPEYFMHQLRGRLPVSQLLDGQKLADRLRNVLSG